MQQERMNEGKHQEQSLATVTTVPRVHVSTSKEDLKHHQILENSIKKPEKSKQMMTERGNTGKQNTNQKENLKY